MEAGGMMLGARNRKRQQDEGAEMKIAHVVDSMEMGGAETIVLQMCRLQREQGHEPRVYAIAKLGVLGEQMLGEGFSVEANLGTHWPDAATRFLSIFRDARPDAVHLHNPTPTFYAGMSARMAGVPCVISTRHSLVAPPHRMIAELKYAVAVRFCDWVVGICDATVNNLRALRTVPAGKLVRVYNGTAPVARGTDARMAGQRMFTLVYVGRLAPVKNHALLLTAFRIALARVPELQLWMVGDGSERQSLEKKADELGIADHVTFWGQQLDVAPFFSGADVFIMSSYSEGLPMSLLQALSTGLPAIVTDAGGMAEVMRMADAGFVVSTSDPSGMAEAIIRLAGDAGNGNGWP